MDRPFGPHFSGKKSRPRSAADESTLWPSLSGEGHLNSLRLGRIASLDPHFTGKQSLPHFHLSKKLDQLFPVVFCLLRTRYGFTRFGGQMQGTQVSRAVTYFGRTYIPDFVLWLRGHNGVARVGEMHDQDFVPRTSGIENLDCVSLTLASRRRKVGLPLAVTSRGKKVGFASANTDRPFNRHFQGKESRLPFASDGSTLWLSLSGKEGRSLHFHRCCHFAADGSTL